MIQPQCLPDTGNFIFWRPLVHNHATPMPISTARMIPLTRVSLSRLVRGVVGPRSKFLLLLRLRDYANSRASSRPTCGQARLDALVPVDGGEVRPRALGIAVRTSATRGWPLLRA